jgi:alkylation response protein AidB-like acyl-CoA dehydrogenase
VPAAAVATHALVACTCDDGARAALAVVVLDDAGVTRMVRHDVPGLRALCCARLVLDRVEVPAERLLAPALGGPRAAFGEAAGGVLAFGIGRAAYEGTLRWARERAWAGHPAVARLELRRMFALLDAARGPVHAAYFAGAGCPVPDEAAVADNAIAARAFAGAVACEVTTEAMRLCADDAAPSGAVGFLDGSAFRPGKLLRDAWAAHNHPKEDQHGLRQDA